MVKLISSSVFRPVVLSNAAHLVRPRLALRCYATQQSFNSEAKRKAVTPFNDDGNVPWTQLSVGEKSARAAQQTFNFGMVIVGVVLTGGVAYFLFKEVFSPDSKISYLNRAISRIKKDQRCLELLGDSNKITAYGEETWNKWRRARPIASTTTKDAQGNEHLRMHFNVEGPKGRGKVNMHLTKRSGRSDYEYQYFFVDVAGHQRIYLENADASSSDKGDKQGFKLFGVKWG
ncbi:mitochondrial import inner membrane translocase subunit tim21 [Phialemonium atrogriseum]|uniref:Mitochondrial import inner membrane translocase subunit Tim21 n=1 Tax=Phialemonium atrogriseum TaxID=1093897 RepID=A0AAJ0C7Q7_9PEZI|nr:mitochondrial import inner membrane translocase subunit tim21 [Phialemonium atrogriseum]KAK1771699.1 mitochondrial import inner membrane translocase subunit tim21 [Phialemonium atrogriseum]